MTHVSYAQRCHKQVSTVTPKLSYRHRFSGSKGMRRQIAESYSVADFQLAVYISSIQLTLQESPAL